MKPNPLKQLQALGQSVWIDDIRRAWLQDGTFARLIEDDGVSGVTSNPAIFEKAMSEGGEYDEAIRALSRAGQDAGAIYERLAIEDIQAAADRLRPTHDREGGRDGFASLEVSPHLADDAEATVREARRLWKAVERPNAMIKVPGTEAGLAAIRTLVSEGVNVNVTLLFGIRRYGEVVQRFIEGLEDRLAAGQPLERVASVASFFLSRIDTHVDRELDALGTPASRELRGRAAVAAARLSYASFREWTSEPRWRRLADAGARPQRLLWASTSAKDPAYEDTKYVEALIGPQTVNTMPLATLEAYRDHGHPQPRIDLALQGARAVWKALYALGIDAEAVSMALEREGIRKFVEPFDHLHRTLELRARESA